MANRTIATAHMAAFPSTLWAPVPSSGSSLFISQGSPPQAHWVGIICLQVCLPFQMGSTSGDETTLSFLSWPSMCTHSSSKVNVEMAQPTDGQALLGAGGGSGSTFEV